MNNDDLDIEFVTPENFAMLEEMADAGDSGAQYALGVHFFGKGDFVEAMAYLKAGVEAGCQKSGRILNLILWEIEHGNSVDLGE